MAKNKKQVDAGDVAPAASSGPPGTYVYFLLKSDGSVLASYGAGTSTLESLLDAGWTAVREVALKGGGALLVLGR